MNIPSKSGAIDVEIHGKLCRRLRDRGRATARCSTSAIPPPAMSSRGCPNSSAGDIDRAMKERARCVRRQSLGRMDIRSRARLVNRLADAFEANLEQLYRLETLNNGRPVNETRRAAVAAAGLLPLFCRSGARAPRFGDPVEGSYLNYTLRTPIGIVAQLHAVQSSADDHVQVAGRGARHRMRDRCKAVRIYAVDHLKAAQIFTEAGLPPGVFNVVLGLGQSAGRMLAEHRDINKLVLTGGTEAGRIAGGAAAKVFAHQTMELGGKTPVMVFDDYDVARPSTMPRSAPLSGRGRPASAPRGISCRRRSTTSSWKAEGQDQNHPYRRSLRSPQPSSAR